MANKLNENYLNNLVKRIINETASERAEQIESMLMGKETDEGNAFTAALAKTKKGGKFKLGGKTFTDKSNYDESELDEEGMCEQCGAKDEVMENEVCECGGMMYEGECTECGKSWMGEETEEGIYDVEDLSGDFDYVQEEEDMDVMDFDDEMDSSGENEEFCRYQKEKFGEDDKRYQEKCSHMRDLARKPISMNERLHGKQTKIDKNKNGRIDAEDFKMLRKGKKNGGETDEQWQALAARALPYVVPAATTWALDKAFGEGELDEEEKFIQKAVGKMKKKGTEGSFKKYCGGEVTKSCIDKAMKSGDPKIVKMANFAKNIKAYKGAEHKESITMTENEMIDFIEKIVKEEKLKSVGKHKGTATYEKAHKGSGKENDDYLKSVTKKMKDYLKDGSMGDYETNPEIFPKGNGELSKMKKKAYVPSDAIQDYTDNLVAAGQENLDYDEIHPSEDWVSKNIEGSSITGNNPEWANTGKSEVNKKRNKIRKDNMLAKIKRKAYNKAPQPVIQDNTGEDNAGKLMMKLESTNEKDNIKLNEEFDRMKQLLNYSKKTQ